MSVALSRAVIMRTVLPPASHQRSGRAPRTQ